MKTFAGPSGGGDVRGLRLPPFTQIYFIVSLSESTGIDGGFFIILIGVPIGIVCLLLGIERFIRYKWGT
ncbi:MAG: hypothetical protein GX072_06255 [Lysinibacillus sp.]|nr:hypothetical protein [Lysinibacillus sp.]